MKPTFNPHAILIALFCLISFSSNAQSSNFCWAFQLDGNDPPWPGYYNNQISDGARLSDGFVICGTTYEHIFPSRNGNGFGRTNFGGAYIAKYDFSGNLQWVNYTIDSNYLWLSMKTTISAVATDGNDRIYICGWTPSKSKFYYNNGQSSLHISTNDTGSSNNGRAYFIAQLDKNGTPLWHTHTNSEPWHIEYASNGKIVVGGKLNYNQSFYNKANDTVYTHTLSGSYPTQFIYWIDTLDGTLNKWSIIKEHAVNYSGIKDITTDNDGNTIVVGHYEFWIKFWAPGSTDSLLISQPNNQAYGGKYYLMKYDTAGKPVWGINTKKSFDPINVRAANDGTIYSVAYGYTGNNDTIPLFNSDSTTTLVNRTGYNLLSIDKDGILKWKAVGGFGIGLGLNVKDTLISVSGYSMPNTFQSSLTDTFYSANGMNNFYLPNASPNIALVHYDSLGNVKHATRTGVSNGRNSYEFMHMLSGDFNSLLVFGDGRRYSGTDSTIFYNDTLKFNEWDGFVIKTAPGICDSINMPAMPPKIFVKNYALDTVLCAGKSFVVYDSIVANFNNNNYFSVFLDNGQGSMPLYIGGIAGTKVDSIICTLPNNLFPNNTYSIFISTSSPNLQTKNSRKLKINAPVVPTVNIIANPGVNIIQGQQVTFTSTFTNGGPSPKFQWLKNSLPILGETNSIYTTTTLANNDTISLRLISDATCPIPDSLLSKKLIIHMPNNINETGISNLKVYPNPNNGKFSILGFLNAKRATVELLNSVGQIVYQSEEIVKDNYLNTMIKLHETIQGVYILRIKANDEIMVRKVSINE